MVGADPRHGLNPIEQGIRLFNDRYFFEAHEVLEDAWHKERGEPRLFLQGLIQICAAYHHCQNGNFVGAATLLGRGAEKMRRYPPSYLGVDAAKLLNHVDEDRTRLERMQLTEAPGAPFEFPKIELIS